MNTHAAAPDPAQSQHIPVLLNEVLDGLNLTPGASIIDATLGGGGHTAAILDHTAPDGRVLGVDADPAALVRVKRRLGDFVAEGRLALVAGFFDSLAQIAADHRFAAVDGILLDLGVSSFQLVTDERGFSLLRSGPLDMRFDPGQALSAAEIVNEWPEQELADIIFRYGEERRSRRIARTLVANRPVYTTGQLADLVAAAAGGRRGARIHPATRTFQALRIAVNAELSRLEAALPQCLALLRPGGRLAVISFHSLEDRIVKVWMAQESSSFTRQPYHPQGGVAKVPTLRLVNRKPVTPAEHEVAVNPRSRSAKLRLAERL